MSAEPVTKRTFAFFDGQNLFHAVKEAFGYAFPNFDVLKLAQAICVQRGWTLLRTAFYTGIPDPSDDPFWNYFWAGKLSVMGRQGVHVFSRSLRYRNRTFALPDGTTHTILVGQEKGVDIRISLDVVRAILEKRCDVALLFSQDQDLSEVSDEVRLIASQQNRWIKMASAFPESPTVKNRRGINKTDWIRFDRRTYDACLDTRDYRPAGYPGRER